MLSWLNSVRHLGLKHALLFASGHLYQKAFQDSHRRIVLCADPRQWSWDSGRGHGQSDTLKAHNCSRSACTEESGINSVTATFPPGNYRMARRYDPDFP